MKTTRRIAFAIRRAVVSRECLSFRPVCRFGRFGKIRRRGNRKRIVPAALLVALLAPASAWGVCDRTQAVQDAIRDFFLVKYPSQSAEISAAGCSDVTREDMDEVTVLNLSNAGVSTLKPGDFAGLRNLEALFLNNNNLEALPSGLFDDLTSLEALFLDNNNLSSLPSGLFDDLAIIVGIALDNNNLSSLPTGLFSGIPLQSLYLHANQFQRLPAGIFSGLGGNGLNAVVTAEQQIDSLFDDLFDEDVYLGLRFESNPKNAPIQHTFSVSLEVSQSPRQAVVRIEEGVPSPTRLTLTINGVEREIHIPVGGVQAAHQLPNTQRVAVVLEEGTIGDPAIVRDFTGVDFSVERQVARLGPDIPVSISASADSVTEGRAATFTLMTDSVVSFAELEVTVDVSGDGADPSEHGTRQVTIPAGSRTTTFTVNARPEDESDQGVQTMTAAVQSGNDAAAGTPPSARVTVREDEDPVIEEAVSEVEGVSGAGETTVPAGTQVILRGRASDVNADQSLTTAWSGPPQVPLVPVTAGQTQEVMFTAPATAGRYTFTFSADDDGDGGDAPVTREVVVEVVSGRGVSIRAVSPWVVEDEGGVTFEVRASMASTTELVVNITLSEEGGMFGLEESARTVTITANETSKRFTVRITDDDRQQSHRALRAAVETGTGYVIVAPSHARVRILDDESLVDVNADGAVNANDALILYYAYSLRNNLGTGR